MTRVLVVEDESGLRRALAINLRAHGYTADVAPDGAAALRAATRHPPDAAGFSGSCTAPSACRA